MWPYRSLIAAGVPAPGHSDFAVCRAAPFTAMACMAARRTSGGTDLDASEAVTPAQVLRAYIWLGAWAQREEADKRSLEPGKLANFAILDTDILGADPEAIRAARVVSTYVHGVERHRV